MCGKTEERESEERKKTEGNLNLKLNVIKKKTLNNLDQKEE